MITAVFVFLTTFLIFLQGVSPSVYGGDSGDIITSAWFGSIAHAPGYPLNSLIGWIFTHLPHQATVAFKANLMGAFFQAAIIFVVFITIRKITKSTNIALASSFTLAFAALFWLYAHIIEVFQLNVLLVSISVYFLLSWRELEDTKKYNLNYFYLALIFLSLAIFHHQTSVLVVPAFAYLVLKTNKKIFKKRKVWLFSLVSLFLGFLPLLYLPIASLLDLPTNWTDASKLSTFIKLITRGDYGSFVATRNVLGSDFISRIVQLANYLLFAKTDFTVLGLIIICIGAVYMYKKDKVLFYFVTLAFLFSGPIFLFYASFPITNDFYKGLWERFILLSYFFLPFYLAFGYAMFLKICQSLLSRISTITKKNMKTYAFLTSLFIFLIPLHLFTNNFQKVDLSNFHLGDWLGNDVLSSAEPNSIVFMLGDTQTFNTEYIYYTSDKYRSIKLIRSGSLSDPYYRAKLVRAYKDLYYPQNFLYETKDLVTLSRSFIEGNIDKHSVYFVGSPPILEGYRTTSSGMLVKLIKNDTYSSKSLVELNERLFKQFNFRDFGADLGYVQFMHSHLKEAYYGGVERLAQELIDAGLRDQADDYLRKAMLLSPESKDAYILLGNNYLIRKDCSNALVNYNKVFEIDDKDWMALSAISKTYDECLHDKKNSDMYKEKADQLKGDNQQRFNDGTN